MMQDKQQQDNLIGSDRVEGTTVYGSDGDKIGSVENLLIDKQSGQVTDAVVSIGGFLGIGEEQHSLPWSMLKYDSDHEGYQINATEEQLKEAPRFEKSDRDRPYDGAYRSNVYNYWAI